MKPRPVRLMRQRRVVTRRKRVCCASVAERSNRDYSDFDHPRIGKGTLMDLQPLAAPTHTFPDAIPSMGDPEDTCADDQPLPAVAKAAPSMPASARP